MAKIELKVETDQTTLDLLLWRRFRREIPGLVTQTLAGNPGLAALGTFLPVGTKVVVTIPEPAKRQPKPLISLWTKAT